jgi:hypothetical protein
LLLTRRRGRGAFCGGAYSASACAGSANAITTQTWSSPTGLNIAIPDNTYDGTLGSMASHAINVGFMPDFVSDVNVRVTMSHSFIGDLTLKLKSPTGTVVTLLNRPGRSRPDDGTDTGGDSSNFSVEFPIDLRRQAPSGVSAELMGMASPLIPMSAIPPPRCCSWAR